MMTGSISSSRNAQGVSNDIVLSELKLQMPKNYLGFKVSRVQGFEG
jgi:hypothetical protein